MSFSVQVTVDSANPHDLAGWWAETLGWQVESQDEAFIRKMISDGLATSADTTEHRGALVWRDGAAIYPSNKDNGPRILFQLVPESKISKNRLHLDIRTGDEDVKAVRERLVQRGAVVLYSSSQGPHSWVTLADPEGNEFCV
ncbi:MAG TPA: VOC family protein [Actinomycetes bacterium]|nr:VOC family protein [Actinomycetes bacterium]